MTINKKRNLSKYIKIYLLTYILISTLSFRVSGQLDTVCVGDRGLLYSYEKLSPYTTENVWTIEGVANGDVSYVQHHDTIWVDWNKAKGGEYYTITLVEYNVFADTIKCMGDPVHDSVYIWPNPLFSIGPDQEVCQGEEATFSSDTWYPSYEWSTGGTEEMESIKTEGYVYLTVTDNQNCSNVDSAYLAVHELPQVYLGEDFSLCGEKEYLVDAGTDGVFYQWYSDRGEETEFYNRQTISLTEETLLLNQIDTLWVSVENVYGCVSGDTIVLSPCNGYLGKIPNIITPNGDGDNDEFIIPRVEKFPMNYSKMVVEIYDRWGKLVWRSDPGYNDNRWKGNDFRGKKLPMDSYFYVIHINNENSEPVTGHITIIR